MEEMDGIVVVKKQQYVLGLDVGTTMVTGSIFDSHGEVIGQFSRQLKLLHPKPGWVEMEPEELWNTVVEVLKGTLAASNIRADELACMGMCTQRATFVTWDKTTGKEFHNFIIWKDNRADMITKRFNESLPLKIIRAFGSFMYLFTRAKIFELLSVLEIPQQLVALKLRWVRDHISAVKNAISIENCLFGTVDTWLMNKATLDKPHITEMGNAVATSLVDPNTGSYVRNFILWFIGIQYWILPTIVDSVGSHLGFLDPEILGASVPIRALMSDVGAAIVGTGSTKKGDISLTIGSGTFLAVNLEDHHYNGPIKTVLPSIAWGAKRKVVHLVEAKSCDTNLILEWAQKIGLFDHVTESSKIVEMSRNDNLLLDMFFVPGFFGLHSPFNDPSATAGIIGITPNTSKPEMLRVLLEAIAFTMKQLVDMMENQSFKLKDIHVSGGVSNNDFVLQLTSTLTGKKIHRTSYAEKAAFGVAFKAGQEAGLWQSTDQLSSLIQVERTFHPEIDPNVLKVVQNRYKKWLKTCTRCMKWN